MNCHPQCNDCNVVKGGNLKVYEQRLRQEYGDDNIDALKAFAQTYLKVTELEIQLVIDKYNRVVF
jgi:3-dehydroquinate dehydratase